MISGDRVCVLAWKRAADGRRSPYPAEQLCVRGACDARRAEFYTGRELARAAAATLDRYGAVIPDDGRRPVWPESLVGSITHTDGFIGAAAGCESVFEGIGLDAESGVMHREAIDLALTPRELDAITATPIGQRESRLTLAFSAKEALFKALPRNMQRDADFNRVEVHPQANGILRFTRPGRPGELLPVQGVWWRKRHCVVTLVVLIRENVANYERGSMNL